MLVPNCPGAKLSGDKLSGAKLSYHPSDLRLDAVTTGKCRSSSEQIVAAYNGCAAVYEHGKPGGCLNEALTTVMDSEEPARLGDLRR